MRKDLKKILFVDDDEDIHLILQFAFRGVPGLIVRSVLSGEEGIKAALEFQPDIILLDVMMPNMDGIATLQTLKVLPSLTNIPVIFLTAKAQKDEVESYFKYGIADVIVKPFDPETLINQVRTVWEKSQGITNS